MAYADPEKQREYQRKWRAANPDKRREYTRKWRAENADKCREYMRQWYASHGNRREYYRKRREEKPDRHRENIRKCYERLRAKVLALLGGKCARCGIDDPIVLQVDHINGGGTSEQKALGGPKGVYRKVLVDPTPYQLLCANCNMRKRFENGEVRKYYEKV